MQKNQSADPTQCHAMHHLQIDVYRSDECSGKCSKNFDAYELAAIDA